MFSDMITFRNVGIALAENVMKNVVGESSGYLDDSFIITLRALLFGKMDNSDKLRLIITRLPRNYESLLNTVEFGDPECLAIYDAREAYLDDSFFIENIRKVIPEEHNGYIRNDKITLFFSSSSGGKFGVVAYINEELKSAVLLVDRLDTQRYHFLQVCIPVLLPWYFVGENCGVTGRDIPIIKALTGKSSGDYKSAIVDAFDGIAGTLEVPTVCPSCGKHGLSPVGDDNHFCHNCFTLFKLEDEGQLSVIKNGE